MHYGVGRRHTHPFSSALRRLNAVAPRGRGCLASRTPLADLEHSRTTTSANPPPRPPQAAIARGGPSYYPPSPCSIRELSGDGRGPMQAVHATCVEVRQKELSTCTRRAARRRLRLCIHCMRQSYEQEHLVKGSSLPKNGRTGTSLPRGSGCAAGRVEDAFPSRRMLS